MIGETLPRSCSWGRHGQFYEASGQQACEMAGPVTKLVQGVVAERSKKVALEMNRSADATPFGFLCVIDGVRAIEHGTKKPKFELLASRQDIRSAISPNTSSLHDLLGDKA